LLAPSAEKKDLVAATKFAMKYGDSLQAILGLGMIIAGMGLGDTLVTGNGKTLGIRLSASRPGPL